jgi:hypothetical protein
VNPEVVEFAVLKVAIVDGNLRLAFASIVGT